MTTDEQNERYTPFLVQRYDGTVVVRVRPDGTPEFGPGVTAENVWATIAEVLPAPADITADITAMTGILVMLPEPGTLWGGV